MPKIFTAPVALQDNAGRIFTFGLGDVVPEWAEARVDEHASKEAEPKGEPETTEPAPEDEATTEVESDAEPEGDVEAEKADAEAEGDADAEPKGEPDFTAPAKPKRGRARKAS